MDGVQATPHRGSIPRHCPWLFEANHSRGRGLLSYPGNISLDDRTVEVLHQSDLVRGKWKAASQESYD